MWNRILLIARTHLAGEWMGERGARLPVAPMLFQASLSALLCGLASGEVAPFGYATFALSIPLALTSLSLLGELGPLLRADPASEWIGAQPVRPIELRAARVLVIATLLGGLALASLVPAAVLAPDGTGIAGRLALVLGGLVLTLFAASLLLWVQWLGGDRAEGLLVAAQTLVFVLVIVGFAAGLGRLHELGDLRAARGALLLYPPAWFAGWVVGAADLGSALGGAALVATLATLAVAPFPPAARARGTRAPLTLLLSPLRALAERSWVRRDERAVFRFVFEALPTERDFVTRTYPLVAIPLAFLLLGAETGTPKGEGLFALLLFAPAAYLPVLLLHVPATATPQARWILDTAPLEPAVESSAARKAVALRFLFPLYLGLAGLTWARGDLALALRLTPVAAAAGLVGLRLLWAAYVRTPPLSTPASELGTAWDDAGSGGMLGVALAATVAAIAAWRFVPGPAWSVAILAAVLVLDAAWAPRVRPAPGV